MANSNFIVHNGLTVGPLTIDASTGAISTTGSISTTSTSPTTFSSANVVISPGTQSTSTTTGALVVGGGVGVSGNVTIGGNATINGETLILGNLTVQGVQTQIGSADLTVNDSIINLHTFANLAPLTTNDGRDIGIKFHYYDGGDNTAFLGRANDTKYLEWYAAGTDTANVFTGSAYGTFKAGAVLLTNTTPTTSTTTGALQVAGGISTQANLYVGSGAYFGNTKSIAHQYYASATAPAATNVRTGDQWYDSSSDILYTYVNDGTSTYWVDVASVPTNYQANISVQGATLSISGNASVGNLTVSGKVYGVATSAQYADLAEMYLTDTNYEAGTVVVFGGDAEITKSTTDHDTRVAGVISTDPAYLMNNKYPAGTYHPVALTGRVPCLVQGPVTKGTVLVTGTEPGTARAIDPTKFQPGVVIGKSLETITDNSIETIEIAVGRF